MIIIMLIMKIRLKIKIQNKKNKIKKVDKDKNLTKIATLLVLKIVDFLHRQQDLHKQMRYYKIVKMTNLITQIHKKTNPYRAIISQ